MRGSPLVYELEDPLEFCLDPLTDSKRPGVQTALPRWSMAPTPSTSEGPAGADPAPEVPKAPPPPSLRERLNAHAPTLVFVAVMALSCAVRWGV